MIKLAWRNIWRNRRRAIITMASVFFAAFFCVLMTSFQMGTFGKMVDNMLKTQTGHIQIHAKEYWDDKVIDNFMFMDMSTIAELENIDTINIENISPRVEIFAMAASESMSKGIAVFGISPEKESQKSNLPSRITEGRYLTETDDGILIGEGLAKYLKVNIGDTLALIGQGYHSSSAAGLFPIRGILKLMTTEMDNGMVYITLPSAQYFIDMPDGYSGILISIKENKRLDEIIHKIEQTVDTEKLNVYSWHFTMERLLQQAESDKAFSFMIILVMYMIVGFGILGTVIMMINERKREFSVMISLGMSRMKLAITTAFELLIMSMMGAVLAIMVTLPIIYWFTKYPIEVTGEMAGMFLLYGMEPILPMSLESSVFTDQITIVFVIVVLVMMYLVNKVLRLKIVKS